MNTFSYRVFYRYLGRTPADPFAEPKSEEQVQDALFSIPSDLPHYLPDSEAEVHVAAATTSRLETVVTVSTKDSEQTVDAAMSNCLRNLELLGDNLKPTGSRVLGVLVAFALAGFLALTDTVQASVTPIVVKNECPSSQSECHEISGLITQKDLQQVRTITERVERRGNKATHFFRLNSKGGDIDAAIGIGRELRKISAVAAVTDNSVCLSACVFVLAGAVQRLVGGRVGIHRPYSSRTDLQDYSVVQKEHKRLANTARAFLEDMNLPSHLYDAMLRVPPEQIRVLSTKELSDYGLDQSDPVEQELVDSAEARKYGLSKLEFIQRKGEVQAACASEWTQGQRTGDFKAYFTCRDQILRGHSR